MLLLRVPGLDPAGMQGQPVSPLGHPRRLRAAPRRRAGMEKASPRCRHSFRGVPQPVPRLSPALLGLPSPTRPGQRSPFTTPDVPSGCPSPDAAQPLHHLDPPLGCPSLGAAQPLHHYP